MGKVPEWVDLIKTNVGKELAPYDEDWFYVRCASMARHIYIRSPVGVSTIRKIYGIRKSNGSKPSHWIRGAGGLARKALQALEGLKVIEKDQNGGRRLTSQEEEIWIVSPLKSRPSPEFPLPQLEFFDLKQSVFV